MKLFIIEEGVKLYMEEKKIIKLYSVIIIILVILLVIGIIFAIFWKFNKKEREKKASVTNSNNVVESEKNINNGNTVKIRYAYTYNVPTADTLNKMRNEEYGEDYIDILEIYLEGDKLDKINELIDKSSFEKADLSAYQYTNLSIGVGGTFEVTINNDIVLLMDQEWSMYSNAEDSYIIHTPEEIFNEVSTIVYEKAYKNSKSYESSKITIYDEVARIYTIGDDFLRAKGGGYHCTDYEHGYSIDGDGEII